MMHISYIPRPRLTLKRTKQNVIECILETRPGIHLTASKTIVVVNQEGDNIADDDILNMDLALFYATQKL